MDKTTLLWIRNRIQEEIEYYDNPTSYQDDDYYTQCSAKVDLCDDLLYTINDELNKILEKERTNE